MTYPCPVNNRLATRVSRRALRAYEARQSGLTFAAIGVELDISANRARQLVLRVGTVLANNKRVLWVRSPTARIADPDDTALPVSVPTMGSVIASAGYTPAAAPRKDKMMTTYVVSYQIRSDWDEDVTCKANNLLHAGTVSRGILAEVHGKIAARWGVVTQITPLRG